MPKKEETDDLIGPTDASIILAVSSETVRNYGRRGILTPVPIGANRQAYKRGQVERLREQLAAEKRKGPRQAKGSG